MTKPKGFRTQDGCHNCIYLIDETPDREPDELHCGFGAPKTSSPDPTTRDIQLENWWKWIRGDHDVLCEDICDMWKPK